MEEKANQKGYAEIHGICMDQSYLRQKLCLRSRTGCDWVEKLAYYSFEACHIILHQGTSCNIYVVAVSRVNRKTAAMVSWFQCGDLDSNANLPTLLQFHFPPRVVVRIK